MKYLRGLPPSLVVISIIFFACATTQRDKYEIASYKAKYNPSKTTAKLKRITFAEGRDSQPAISPDGKYIAFTSERNGNFDIFIKNLAGGRGDIQKTFSQQDEYQSTWSPDGTKLVFSSTRLGTAKIFSIDIGSSSKGVVQLTRGQAEDQYPFFSPDGKILGYCSKALQSRDAYLWMLNFSDNSLTQLFPADNPFWDKNDKIYYQSYKAGGSDIWKMDADGSNETQLTFGEGFSFDPAVSPDGRWIAFATTRNDISTDIWIMSIDGNRPTQLTTHPGVDRSPEWAPDGKTIYFYSDRGGRPGEGDIWAMEVGFLSGASSLK